MKSQAELEEKLDPEMKRLLREDPLGFARESKRRAEMATLYLQLTSPYLMAAAFCPDARLSAYAMDCYIKGGENAVRIMEGKEPLPLPPPPRSKQPEKPAQPTTNQSKGWLASLIEKLKR